MFDADTKLREIFARRKQDIPWTPQTNFEAIGGPKFLEFIPAQSRLPAPEEAAEGARHSSSAATPSTPGE